MNDNENMNEFEMKWNEMKWSEMRWNEMKCDEMKWNEMKWNEMIKVMKMNIAWTNDIEGTYQNE
jgi:hypothetical protein